MQFSKFQGTGNDFVLVDARRLERDWSDLARKVCDRHFGVGADGLLVVQRATSPKAAFRMRMFNLDGSEGPRAQSTRAFARNLALHVSVPIAFWDERLSTAAVERHLIEADVSRKRRAELVDRMAAAYILQGALDRLSRIGKLR